MLDILLDAGLDSAKMLPFLYLAYLLCSSNGSNAPGAAGSKPCWRRAAAGARLWAHCWAPFPSADSLPWQPAFTAVGSSRWEP